MAESGESEKKIDHGDGDSTTTTETPTDPSVDPFSELFDPLKALYAPNLRITPKAKKVYYQNLAAFETALKKHGIYEMSKKKNIPSQQQKTDNEKPCSSKDVVRIPETRMMPLRQQPSTEIVDNPRIKGGRHKRNVLQLIENSNGPCNLLKKCVLEGKKVRVYTRREHGIRGHIDGTLVVYDKHWNLLMKDVEEVWQRRKYKYGENKACLGQPVECGERLALLGMNLPVQEVKSVNRKNVQITRKLQQLLVRGEQVVLVNVINDEE